VSELIVKCEESFSSPPVLLLIFNRPKHTENVLAAIRSVAPSRLYVAADGPRSDVASDEWRCLEARKVIEHVDWPCEVKTLFREDNIGCRRAVSSAISWFFTNEECGIILEDDCVPDRSFFRFCSDLLERYRNDEKIMCITGNNFQESMDSYPYSYYFSIFNHCWGWASWRRAWAHFDSELESFFNQDNERILKSLSALPNFAAVFGDKFWQIKLGKLDSWAYIWTWSCWARGGVTCTPRVNLVKNIGIGAEATHTETLPESIVNTEAAELHFPLIHPPVIELISKFDENVSINNFGVKTLDYYRPLARLRRLVIRIIRKFLLN
jgi:hypothetical protein